MEQLGVERYERTDAQGYCQGSYPSPVYHADGDHNIMDLLDSSWPVSLKLFTTSFGRKNHSLQSHSKVTLIM